MFVGCAVQPFQRFAHHQKFCLAIPLENLGVALPQHLGHEMVGNASGAESSGKGVAEMVQREVRNTRSLQGGSPDLS